MANQMAGSVAPGIAPRPIAPLTATVARRPAGNRLLASFPQWDRAHLAPEIEEVRLVRGQLLFEAGRVPGHVYFPHEGTMVSLVLPLRDGRVTETITVGREGAAGLGVDAADGSVDAFVRGVVQMPGM